MAKKAIEVVRTGNKAQGRAKSSVKNVVIGWSEAQSATNFKKTLREIFLSIPGLTDSRHIKYLTSKSDIDEAVYSGSCDILFLSENVNGTPIGKGEIRKYLANGAEGINVILVVSDDKKGAGKLKGLYGYGYYNAIYKKDCYPDYIGELVKNPRTAPDAYDYYGLADYVDPLDSTNVPMPQELREVVEMPVPAEKPDKEKKTLSKDLEVDPSRVIGSSKRSKKADKADEEPDKRSLEKGEGDGADRANKADVTDKADIKEKKGKNAEVDADTDNNTNGVVDVVTDADGSADDGADSKNGSGAQTKGKATARGRGKAEQPEKEPKEVSSAVEAESEEVALDQPENAASEELLVEDSGKEEVPSDDTAKDTAKSSDGPSKSKEQEPISFPKETLEAGGWLSNWSDSEVMAYLKSCELEMKQQRVAPAVWSETDAMVEKILDHYTRREPAALSNLEKNLMTREDFNKNLTNYMTRTFKPESDKKEDLEKHRRLMTDAYDNFLEFMYGYDIVTPLIEDSMVSDIKIYDPDNIRVKRHGKRQEAAVKFRSPEHYRAFVSHIARKNHVSISKDDSIVHFTDTTSFNDFRMRINISTEFVNSDNYPCVHIRKINNQKYTTQQLVDAKMLSYRTAAYLIDKAQNDSGIIFTGKGSAGKTTCMNWLIDYIPRDCSALCIQESDELFSSSHPDILFQRIADDKESQNTYDLKTLAINGLLTDIDYFIIGEIKGAEAKYFLNASYTGNRCWASVHSPSSQDALNKIADYATYESDYTKNELLPMLTSLKVVVFLKDFRIVEISEVEGWDEKNKCLRYKRVPLD